MKKILLIILLVNSLIFTTSYVGREEKEYEISSDLIDKDNLKAFLMILNIIKHKYVEEVDEKKLVEAALSGMLESLDPYSEYFTEEEYKHMLEKINAEFGGIGVEFAFEGGGMKVISPIEDTPAYRAGLVSGDVIVAINDENVSDLNRFDAVKKMRGKPGTKVKLTVFREGEAKPLTFTLMRELIKFNTVKYSYEDDIGYIRVLSFSKNTTESFIEAYNQILKQNSDLQGLIIDLRSNPGGLLNQAVDLASLFIQKGNILSIKDRDRKEAFPTKSSGKIITGELPVVVLIDKGSASCSEIFAGALQDDGKAKIIGSKSYGKGTVQVSIDRDLPPHFGGFKFTTAYFFTPKGNKIQAIGITPDIKVELKNPNKLFEELQKVKVEKSLRSNNSSKKIPDNLWSKMLEYDNVLDKAFDFIKGEAKSDKR